MQLIKALEAVFISSDIDPYRGPDSYRRMVILLRDDGLFTAAEEIYRTSSDDSATRETRWLRNIPIGLYGSAEIAEMEALSYFKNKYGRSN